MNRRWVALVLNLALLLLSPAASARLDPLKQMQAPSVRPEIFILFDDSGSMCGRTDTTGYTGTSSSGDDCMGSTPGWMVDGDGLCIGYETTAANGCGTFSPGKCYSGAVAKSRNWRAKEALRNVVPDLRTVANFGLAGYKTHAYGGATNGYWAYQQQTTGTTGKATVFLHQWELRSAGSWTGAVWDTGGNRPPVSFVKSFSGQTVTYTLVNATDLTTNLNSLYRRLTGTGYTYARYTWSGLTYNDGSYDWEYVGSFYWYTAYPLSATTITLGQYHGPVYYHSDAKWYEYKRYVGNIDCSSTNQGMDLYSPQGAMFYSTLMNSDTQSDHDLNMGKLLNAVNTRSNGGIISVMGGTPGQEAILDILNHWKTRAATDPMKNCRNRSLLVFSDGQFTTGAVKEEIRELYCEFCNNKADCISSGPNGTNCDPALSNPITSTVVAVIAEASISSTDRTYLNEASDMGDNGLIDGSTPKALYSSSDKDLVDNIKAVINKALSGDFSTSAAGVATSGTKVGTGGDWAILPSFEYPGWKGHLRAFDLTVDPPVEEWDAATILNARSVYTRRIFTGFPDYDAGSGTAGKGGFIEILDSSGTLTATAEASVRAVWKGKVNSTIPDTLTNAQMQAFFQWLYGATRSHRLGPILRSVPAVVDIPSGRNLTGHQAFVDGLVRETLIYITSNEGLIHAFRNGKAANNGGQEVFAFIPPSLLDKAYKLYQKSSGTLPMGQETSPSSFQYVLANSPRVDDVYDAAAGKWATHVMVPFGPYNRGFVALDVTTPTNCTVSPCTLNVNMLKVAASVHDDAGTVKIAHCSYDGSSCNNSSFGTFLGEAWSLPAIYWKEGSGAANSKASMGSGYGASTSSDFYISQTDGHYYNYFANPWLPPTQPGTNPHAPPALADVKVDYAVLADTVAAVNWSAAIPDIIATYQVDLNGRLVRYKEGKVGGGDVTTLLAADATRPFYYAPAVLHVGGTTNDQVVLALSSGSADEATPPTPDITSKLYLRAHTSGGTFDTDYNLTCTVGSLNSCTGVDASAITDSSLWPPAGAKPVGSPLLVWNDLGGGSKRVEVFFLLYNASAATSCSVTAGTTYLVRYSVNTTDPSLFKIESIQKSSGRAGGMTLAGGGKRVVLSKSSSGGGDTAKPDHGGNPVPDGGTLLGTPRIEVWREVR